MKIAAYATYGGPEVLKTQTTDKPVPGDKEVLVRVHAAAVNYGDLAARDFGHLSAKDFNMPGLFWVLAKLGFGLGKPRNRVLGNEFSGVVEQAGKDVTRFKAGDAVFGYTGQAMGAYAEYICLSETGYLSHKPKNTTFDQAASVPMGALMALNLLKKAQITDKSKVLIIGASGSIGNALLQIAKQKGASVDGACGTERTAYVRMSGADKVIDYTITDYTKSDSKYDVIFDVLGKSSFSACRRILSPQGCYFRVSFKLIQLLQMVFTSFGKGQKVICALADTHTEDLPVIQDMVERGVLNAEIDRSFPLDQAAEAHSYAESGKRKGKVVISMMDSKVDAASKGTAS